MTDCHQVEIGTKVGVGGQLGEVVRAGEMTRKGTSPYASKHAKPACCSIASAWMKVRTWKSPSEG